MRHRTICSKDYKKPGFYIELFIKSESVGIEFLGANITKARKELDLKLEEFYQPIGESHPSDYKYSYEIFIQHAAYRGAYLSKCHEFYQ